MIYINPSFIEECYNMKYNKIRQGYLEVFYNKYPLEKTS